VFASLFQTYEAAVRYAALVFACEAKSLVRHPRIKLPEISAYLNENYAGMGWVPTCGGSAVPDG